MPQSARERFWMEPIGRIRRQDDPVVLAVDAPFRPNPIAMTTCPILAIDQEAGRVWVGAIDAFDGTRIVDLKAYLPICDRV